MTLTELRYIAAVARERHFGRAAEACHVSQPTLSVAVAKLEDELGVRLFERRRQDVLVTAVGQAIVRQAEEILRASAELREFAQAARDPLGQRLRLGIIYTVGPHLVPHLIPGLKRHAPRMTLEITENFTEHLAASLKRGELDVVIMSLPYRDTELVSRPLYEEPFDLALPRDHRLAARKRVKPQDLVGETLLLLGARNCFRDQVVEFCPIEPGPDGLTKTLEGSSLETICQMVALGAGVTVLPTTMRLSDPLAHHLVRKPFVRPHPSRTIAAFYRRGFARPQVIQLIATVVREARLAGVDYCT
jgi:LysR family hydrogen peroxide-inducible transcriptional activator